MVDEEPHRSQGPEEMCFSLEHQNPSKDSEKWVILIVTVSLHILYTANQETEGSQDLLTVYNAESLSLFFYSALRASVTLRATCCVPAKIWLALIDFQNVEQQSRSGSDKKQRNRLQ